MEPGELLLEEEHELGEWSMKRTAVVGPAIGKLVFVRPGAPGAEGMGQCSEERQQYLVGSETGDGASRMA